MNKLVQYKWGEGDDISIGWGVMNTETKKMIPLGKERGEAEYTLEVVNGTKRTTHLHY